MERNLEKVRKEIDRCDRELVRLLEKRLLMAEEVARIKETQSNVSLTDPKRESDMIQRLIASTSHQVLQSEIPRIFSICMDMSKRVRVIKHQREKNRYLPSLEIGIIGLGNFGEMLAETFRLHWPQSRLYLYDPIKESSHTLEETCKTDLLFCCVPISAFESCLQQAAPHLEDRTTVIDVCTVKVYAVQTMERVLKGRRMIASHPMFGPQSTKMGTDFFGLNLVAHNLSAPAFIYDVFLQLWNNLGVQIIELSPEEHDTFAAYSINYNHFVGRIGECIGLQTTPIDTRGFKVIYDAMHYVTNDTWQLFRDMQTYNPFAREMREKVRSAIASIEKKLGKGPSPTCIQ
ncbi:MAG: hypothetical protein CR997_10115 [Acidobacteria bacterium]|nr:MAG: hypothetical protein CR997_10115 [Acidobacteriota bacterium]